MRRKEKDMCRRLRSAIILIIARQHDESAQIKQTDNNIFEVAVICFFSLVIPRSSIEQGRITSILKVLDLCTKGTPLPNYCFCSPSPFLPSHADHDVHISSLSIIALFSHAHLIQKHENEASLE